ncbi:MAG: hypothetical protein CL858_24235 [Cupriavidus sp.]|nr:hypothetical protein [Cupriavidus sp.]
MADRIDSLCMTWRHDYGLHKADDDDSISSGMTTAERESLRRKMTQIHAHHIAPLEERIRELELELCGVEQAHDAMRNRVMELERARQPGGGEAVVKRHLIEGAIEIIQGGADSLRECLCMNGDWGSDVEAKHAYGVEISVADGLRAALVTQSPEASDAACASLDEEGRGSSHEHS